MTRISRNGSVPSWGSTRSILKAKHPNCFDHRSSRRADMHVLTLKTQYVLFTASCHLLLINRTWKIRTAVEKKLHITDLLKGLAKIFEKWFKNDMRASIAIAVRFALLVSGTLLSSCYRPFMTALSANGLQQGFIKFLLEVR